MSKEEQVLLAISAHLADLNDRLLDIIEMLDNLASRRYD